MHAADNCFAGEDCIFMHNIFLSVAAWVSPQTKVNFGLELIYLYQLEVDY